VAGAALLQQAVVDRLFVICAYRDPNGVDWYGSQPRAPAIAELIRREGSRVHRIALPADVPPEVDVQAITTDATGALSVSVIRKGIYRLVNNAWIQPPELLDAGKLPAMVMKTDSTGHVWLGYPANRLVRWDMGVARLWNKPVGTGVLRSKGDPMFIRYPSIVGKLAAALTVSALHVGFYDLLRVFVP